MQMSEIEKLRNINRLKIYRGAPGLAARELVRDEAAEPEGNVYF